MGGLRCGNSGNQMGWVRKGFLGELVGLGAVEDIFVEFVRI